MQAFSVVEAERGGFVGGAIDCAYGERAEVKKVRIVRKGDVIVMDECILVFWVSSLLLR